MKTRIILCFGFIFCFHLADCQTVTLAYLPPGSNSGSCINISDEMDIQCYDIIYVPGTTGILTSYTLGFLGTCIEGGSAYIASNTSSCVMSDNSDGFDGCAALGQFLMNLSGNNNPTPISAGVPIAVHQVCLTIPLGETILVTEETVTGLTFSVNPEGAEDPEDYITEVPDFVPVTLYNESDCEFTDACTIEFGLSSNMILFDTLADGTIANGANLNNSIVPSQSFDVFDEIGLSCLTSGGEDDITFDFQILNTLDINGNGLIDEFAGIEHSLIQTSEGITASIPFNTSATSESSAGDIRGYSIEVQFAEHIKINAHQLTVMLDGMNSANQAFEAAALIFSDKDYIPFGSATHVGYFNGENDLSGNCNSTSSSLAFIKSGTGVVLFQDTSVVDLTLPCDPTSGTNGINNILDVNAKVHGGLDSMTVIGGFKLIVIGEDVAAPNALDDGSGNAPEDTIPANAQTNTIATLTSLIKGIKIVDCVQYQSSLPLKWSDFHARANNNAVDLHWSTSNEVNTESFVIQWSSDGKSFAPIGDLASENRMALNEYFFTHANPTNGINYYRIQQIDLDGRFSYSVIVSVTMHKENSNILIYPNPVENTLFIDGYPAGEKISYKIYSATGHISNCTKNASSSIDISQLSAGLYTIILTSESNVSSHQFLKY